MKKIICLFILAITIQLSAQTSTNYADNQASIKSSVTNYKSYMLLNIENTGRKTIYIPDFFRVDNDCGKMDCYLANTLDFYPFVNQEMDIIEIEPGADWGIVYKISDIKDFEINEVHINYSCKKLKKRKVIDLIDRLKKAYLKKG